MDKIHEIFNDTGNGDIVNIQLIPFDEKQHQIEWSFEKW